MGITWNPLTPVGTSGPSKKGSPNAIGNGTDHWLTCEKGVAIGSVPDTWVQTTHTGQVSAVVSHVCNPPAPPGLIITDDPAIGGIKVSGTVTDIMNTSKNVDYSKSEQITNISSLGKPADGIMTHYTPLPTDRIVYTITITVVWHWTNVVYNDSTTTYTADYKIAIYNNWNIEKSDVNGLTH